MATKEKTDHYNDTFHVEKSCQESNECENNVQNVLYYAVCLPKEYKLKGL